MFMPAIPPATSDWVLSSDEVTLIPEIDPPALDPVRMPQLAPDEYMLKPLMFRSRITARFPVTPKRPVYANPNPL